MITSRASAFAEHHKIVSFCLGQKATDFRSYTSGQTGI